MSEKSCATCKYRFLENASLEIYEGKFGTKIYSNCEKFKCMGRFNFDPYSSIGVRLAFDRDFCCKFYEEDPEKKAPAVIHKKPAYVDFTEPRPPKYDVSECGPVESEDVPF